MSNNNATRYRATVLLDYATFWVGVVSNPVRVKGSREASPGVAQPPLNGRSENVSEYTWWIFKKKKKFTHQKFDVQGVKEIEMNMYNGCGKNKNCVGSPLGCLSSMNCQAVVTLMSSNDKYQFEMLAHNSQYVAFGLSDDNKMVKY